MKETSQLNGELVVYRVRNDIREIVHHVKNTIGTTMKGNLAAVLISRSVEYGVDAIGMGSFITSSGTYVTSTWAGTTSSGTIGNLIQSNPSNGVAKFVGTFQFGATAQVNRFRLGRGYTAAGAGVTEIFTSLYAYDNSLSDASSYLTYVAGDILVVDWTITLS